MKHQWSFAWWFLQFQLEAVLVTDGCRHLCEDTAKSGRVIETHLHGESVAQAVGETQGLDGCPLSMKGSQTKH